jgi:hypothetical protein
MFQNPVTATIGDFLAQIGICMRVGETPPDSFLPGVCVDRGVLVVNESQLTYCGDLLHEAGHLAVLSSEQREAAGPAMGNDGGYEMAAIAWSYAAAVHLGLDPAIVFHSGGYRGGSQTILDNFGSARYVGVPLLEWMGMTLGPERAEKLGVAPYPKMLLWLRPDEPSVEEQSQR